VDFAPAPGLPTAATGVDRPAGDVDERLSGAHRIGDRRQSRRAVDVDVHPVPVTRERWPIGPSIAPPLERVGGADTGQAASVMLAAGRLDEGARSGVQRPDEASNHTRQSTAPATASPDPRCGERLQSDGPI
jgi:hypothetical protein